MFITAVIPVAAGGISVRIHNLFQKEARNSSRLPRDRDRVRLRCHKRIARILGKAHPRAMIDQIFDSKW
jgi:hypothetical protein